MRIPKRAALKGTSQNNDREEVVQNPTLASHPEKMPERRAVIPGNIFQGSLHFIFERHSLFYGKWYGMDPCDLVWHCRETERERESREGRGGCLSCLTLKRLELSRNIFKLPVRTAQ
jgi:hypothetical protein